MGDLIGHAWADTLLRRHIASGQARHAYLITGADGVGKRTLARRMVQAWGCTRPPGAGQACGVCRFCKGVEAGAFPDLHILGPEESGGSLRIEAVRELERQLALSPYEARGRAGILESFHLASEGAANALLKTLEEPPPHTLLILTAISAEDLLPTIVSRCEVIRLRPVPRPDIERALIAEGATPEEAAALAEAAEGRPGWALRQWRDAPRRQARKRSLGELNDLLHAGRSDRLVHAEKLVARWKDLDSYDEKRKALLEYLEPWSAALRSSMRQALGVAGAAAGPWRIKPSDAPGWIRGMRALEHTADAVRRNAHLQLTLESMLLDLPTLEEETTPVRASN